MFKKVQFVQTCESETRHCYDQTDWRQCIICQEQSEEPLTCPANSKRKDSGKGYATLAQNLEKFNELSRLPRTLQLSRLDEGNGVEATLMSNRAKWHQKCMLRYKSTKLEIAVKRVVPSSTVHVIPEKRTRACSPHSEISSSSNICFFCGKIGEDPLHSSATFQINERVTKSAEQAGDNELLAKLSRGDMIAQKAKYHKKCLLALYYRAKIAKIAVDPEADRERVISSVAFAELVMYIEDSHLNSDTAPVFRMAELANLYKSRLEHYGIALENRVHSTRLKERLLSKVSGLKAVNHGREVLLAFDEDLGGAIDQACDQDKDSDAIHLARAAQIIRRDMFEYAHSFSGSFEEGCQERSAPNTLISLVSMILEGPDIHRNSASSQAALSISQLLKFNSVKHHRNYHTEQERMSATTVRHSITEETPLPIYVGLVIHAETRKKGLVDKLFNLGLSISYDRILRLSAEMGNSVCRLYEMEQVVCPPILRGKLFTTAAVDNIDHNPSSTTAKDSFHGTGISLIQHPTCPDDGVDRSIATIRDHTSSKAVDKLPQYYTEVAPVESNMKESTMPPTSLPCMKSNNFQRYQMQEHLWLEHTMSIVKDASDSTKTYNEVSWSGYHASLQEPNDILLTPTALLPLFKESAHTVAMIRHSMDVVRNAVEHLNPDQTPVITFDQPLFALGKQIQWKWPDQYGEDNLVVMFGGLHIELAALKTLGNWLEGSGWVEALVQAEIATTGKADSYLRASHITRTRRAHQVTASSLYILQQRAYDHYCADNADSEQSLFDFESWCKVREEESPQFQYWAIVMSLE